MGAGGVKSLILPVMNMNFAVPGEGNYGFRPLCTGIFWESKPVSTSEVGMKAAMSD